MLTALSWNISNLWKGGVKFCTAKSLSESEGEVAFFNTKRWNRRNKFNRLIKSATPRHDAQVVGSYRVLNSLHLTVLAARSEDCTIAPQHLKQVTHLPLSLWHPFIFLVTPFHFLFTIFEKSLSQLVLWSASFSFLIELDKQQYFSSRTLLSNGRFPFRLRSILSLLIFIRSIIQQKGGAFNCKKTGKLWRRKFVDFHLLIYGPTRENIFPGIESDYTGAEITVFWCTLQWNFPVFPAACFS